MKHSEGAREKLVLVCASLKGKPKGTHEHGERDAPMVTVELGREACRELSDWVDRVGGVEVGVHDMDAPTEQLYKVCRRRERERERERVCLLEESVSPWRGVH